MKPQAPLQLILTRTISEWDLPATRPAVRSAFSRAVQCRTAVLGGEVYASEEQEAVFYHSCKSRACPSCGYRATVQWQRELWAALPEGSYAGITFTMPDTLWPLFRDNPRLCRALPALAASIIQAYVAGRYGARIGIIAILHTFNGKLEFNSHVHTMVTGGGLIGCTWVARIYFDRDRLMEAWRRAVIRILRTALRAGQVFTEVTKEQIETNLSHEETRWWSAKIQSFTSKERFLRYAGRYVRRPPIAQRRIVDIGRHTVTFWAKDKRHRCRVVLQYSLKDFVDHWAQHIPERYQHAIRSFGLFAPRALAQTNGAIFALLQQRRRPRPKRRRWADSLRRDFGRDPLLDPKGKRMNWVQRLPPKHPG
jgi:hypothetical protein